MKRQPTVCMFFKGDTIGGSHRSSIDILTALHQSIDFRVLVAHEGKLTEYLSCKNIPYTVLIRHSILLKSVPIVTLMLLFFLYKSKATCLHLNDSKTLFLIFTPLIWLAGFPILFHLRTRFAPSLRLSSSLLFTKHIISISRYVQSTLPAQLQKKSIIIYNHLSISHTQQRTLKSHPPMLLVIGNDSLQKGWHIVLDSIRFTKSTFSIYFVGSTQQQFFSTIAKYKSNRVDIQHSEFIFDPSPLYQSATVLIAPAFNEGFGRTLVEATFFNIPFIASNSGAHPEIAHLLKTGLLYDSGDPKALANQIDTVLTTSTLSTTHPHSSPNRFCNSPFPYTNLLETYLNVL